jgi:hypothetical protein
MYKFKRQNAATESLPCQVPRDRSGTISEQTIDTTLEGCFRTPMSGEVDKMRGTLSFHLLCDCEFFHKGLGTTIGKEPPIPAITRPAINSFIVLASPHRRQPSAKTE